jgi:hypothetical protein
MVWDCGCIHRKKHAAIARAYLTSRQCVFMGSTLSADTHLHNLYTHLHMHQTTLQPPLTDQLLLGFTFPESLMSAGFPICSPQ